jgi:hypothetical protein
MQQVTPERTGWRDMNLSERHRLWGWDCPAVDLDFLFLEYDRGKAVALVEYKHERAKPQMPIHPTYQAMKDLADRAGVPFFACRYKGDFSEFLVVPLNENARKILPVRTPMSEAGWVSFLYMARGREVPTSIVDSLMTAF